MGGHVVLPWAGAPVLGGLAVLAGSGELRVLYSD